MHEDSIIVFGKGRKEQEVGIGSEVRKLLWKYLAKYRRPASPEIRQVFLNVRGQPLTINGIEQVLQQVKEQAGIEGVRVSAYTFRHTFARMFLERGGEFYKLSRLMGHMDVKTTEKYLKEFTSREARRTASVVLSSRKFRPNKAEEAKAQGMKQVLEACWTALILSQFCTFLLSR